MFWFAERREKSKEEEVFNEQRRKDEKKMAMCENDGNNALQSRNYLATTCESIDRVTKKDDQRNLGRITRARGVE